ncbi:SpoIIIAH-like family protein [Virgibacillus siamensis]|uniref:SpoIIIAH-like family protein n=1 Tax=Virgibacillus siamensis TaxID=480071 RepID=UPI00098606D2|nr:SpoIIIAH-like family protein [Virgibacillus siamensis]
MLKKQTVWLLTMLSLMIVLSVYYVTSPSGGDFAYVNDGTDNASETEKASTEKAKKDDAKVNEISNLGEDQLFTTMRMEIQNERSKVKDRLDDVVASSGATIQEKNKARNKMNQLDEYTSKEAILEKSIISSEDYKDVLVRYDEDKVHVHVKADKLSKTEVVNIMQMVYDEFGNIDVSVDRQPVES